MVTDYSDLEQEIKDAPEPKVLPRGSEVKARIVGIRTGQSEKEGSNGATWYQPILDVPADPLVVEFNGFLWELADVDKLEPKKAARVMPDFRKFAACFGLDYSRPFDWELDLIGLEGWVILGFKKSEEYGDQNTVAKYVTGK